MLFLFGKYFNAYLHILFNLNLAVHTYVIYQSFM